MVSGEASIGGDMSWPELGFVVVPEKSEKELGSGVPRVSAAADSVL
jgi:hypothetical protein